MQLDGALRVFVLLLSLYLYGESSRISENISAKTKDI